MRTKSLVAAALAVMALGSFGASWSPARAQYYNRDYNRDYRYDRYALVPAGTPVQVRLDSKISTENATRGQSWMGTVIDPVMTDDGVAIPAGTQVRGVVTSAAQGTHDSRPQIGLAVRRVNLNGRWTQMTAYTEPIVADTPRAKKIGAIAGGAAAGALLGHLVGHGHHGTLIGGILGGAAGYGLTRHAFRTMQLDAGTVLTFTTQEDVLAWR